MSRPTYPSAEAAFLGAQLRGRLGGSLERLKTQAGRTSRDIGLNRLCSVELLPPPIRARLLRAFGLDVDPTSRIYPRCFFGGTKVHIGRHTFVNYDCFFDNSAAISLGANCSLGMAVLLCTSYHDVGGHGCRAGAVRGAPIVVEDGCWIGASSTLLPGITVREGCIIAAGSVVASDCEADGLYAGNPAKRVRDL